MPTVTRRHLTAFEKAVHHYVIAYGLTGWTIEIHHEGTSSSMNGRASCAPQLDGRRVDIYLPTSWEDEDVTPLKLDSAARHEVIHILLARMSGLAADRHCTGAQLYEAEEELVTKIMEITAPLHVKRPKVKARRAKVEEITQVESIEPVGQTQ